MQMNSMQNQLQVALRELQRVNPQKYQEVNQLMQSNVDPANILKQWYGTANDTQKKNLFNVSKQWGCPDNILSQIQNIR